MQARFVLVSIKLKNFIKQLVKIKLPKNDVLPADCIIVTGEMENMIHWGIKMTMYLLQCSDKKLICPIYFSDRDRILIFFLLSLPKLRYRTISECLNLRVSSELYWFRIMELVTLVTLFVNVKL